MSYIACCKNCARYRLHGYDNRCGTCGHSCVTSANDIQARATVGSSFIAPEPDDEALAMRIAEFLRGRLDNAENVARNLATVLICDFDIQPKGRG